MMITLFGSTLSPGTQSLRVPGLQHAFQDLPIGMMNYPVQSIRLTNDGDTNIRFRIDIEAIKQVCAFYGIASRIII
jgi:hypothetical protein